MRRTPVLVNALSARLGGGLSFILRELEALEAESNCIDLEVLAAPWNAADLKATLGCPVRTVPVSGPGARFVYEQTVIPRHHSRRGLVLYYPANFAPLARSRFPLVLTLQNPNYFGPARSLAHNRSLAQRIKIRLSHASVRRADHVVAISESLRADVVADIPDAAAKMTVIQSGSPTWPDDEIVPAGPVPSRRSYFLSVANDGAQKRLDDLVLAWADAFAETNDGPSLVLAGDIRSDRRRHHAVLAGGAARKLIHTGGVPDRRELRWWVANATAVVSFSSAEAHPLVPAEAGALGCPLILSDIAPHLEVAGDNAIYVPGNSRTALSAVLRHVHTNPPDRTVWRWPVTWQDHARELAVVLERAGFST